MAFQHKYNTDNIHSRAIIVGLINLLNNKIQYENVLSDTEKDVIEVPWFFAKSVDERFLQDYFTFWSDCIHPKLVDGNYDVTPRGIVTLSSKGIESSSLTQRFVRGSYVREIDGKLETFNSYLNSIPLKMNFECNILCSSYTDSFKIEQALLETFYKVQVFNVSFKGFRIPAQVGFPEDFGLEKTFEYSYGDDNETTINFSLELETYYPVLDKTSERHESNRMSGFSPTIGINNLDGIAHPEIRELNFLSPVQSGLVNSLDMSTLTQSNNYTPFNEFIVNGYNGSGSGLTLKVVINGSGSIENILISNQGIDYTEGDEITILGNEIGAASPSNDATIFIDSVTHKEKYYVGSTLPFRWSTTGSILRVNLEYSLDSGSTWKTIKNQIVNNGSYDWLIENFADSYPTAILSKKIPDQNDPPNYTFESYQNIVEASVRPIVDGTGAITDIIIFDGGLGYDNLIHVDIEENKPGVDLAEVEPIVTNGKIVGFDIIDGGSGYTPSQQFNISFRITDSNTQNVINIVNNVLII